MTSRASRPWKSDLIEVALIFAVFFVQGAWPVPDVNEPYYLGKAIHFWNPSWVQGDFFLDSADAHGAFYFAFGWLSLAMSPPALAWVGRLLTWGLLAWSWQRLSWAVVPRRGMAVLTGALFACLVERCQMAGEWVIGGVEAKGFAYVLVFLGLEAMVRNRWNRAWLLFGAASLLHVVVGGWVVVAAGFAWLLGGWHGVVPVAMPAEQPGHASRGHATQLRPPLRSMLPGLLGGLAISLPSLIPLLALNWGVDTATAIRAHWIYVYYRLPHHLILSEFRWDFLLRFGAMTAVWGVLCWAIGRDKKGTGAYIGIPGVSGENNSRVNATHSSQTTQNMRLSPFSLRGFVFGSLAIALAGAALSVLVYVARAWGARVLRFYWFRLSDVAVPMGVALFAVLLIGRWLQSRPVLGRSCLAIASLVAVLHVGDFVWLRTELVSGLKPAVPRADLKVDKLGGYAAWREACEWIAFSGVIPADARFLTPIDSQTFKWLTRRPEVVTRKDVPQDAKSIVAWWDRLRDIHGIGPDEPRRYWHTSLAELPEERLRELGAKYGAASVLTEAPGVQLPEAEMPETGLSPPKPAPRLNLKELYSNRGYIIYAIAPP